MSSSRTIWGVDRVVGVPPPMYRVRRCLPLFFIRSAVTRISRSNAARYGSRSSVFLPMVRLTKLQ